MIIAQFAGAVEKILNVYEINLAVHLKFMFKMFHNLMPRCVQENFF